MSQSASLDVPADRYAAIEQDIASSTSPVGIDAKKTHIIILHKLEEIERRLRRLEAHLGLPGEEATR
jgi:archaellum component FlaC